MSEFSDNSEEGKRILSALGGTPLKHGTPDEFIRDTAEAAQEALCFRDYLEKEHTKEGQEKEKKIRWEIRKEVTEPLEKALQGLKGLSQEARVWIGMRPAENEWGTRHPGRRESEALLKWLKWYSDPRLGRPPMQPIQILVSRCAGIWVKYTGAEPTNESGRETPFLDYIRAAIAPTGLRGAAKKPDSELVHHIREEIKHRSNRREKASHGT